MSIANQNNNDGELPSSGVDVPPRFAAWKQEVGHGDSISNEQHDSSVQPHAHPALGDETKRAATDAAVFRIRTLTGTEGELRHVDARADDGSTALYRACRDGHVEAAKCLVAGEANISLATDDGWTPLLAAADEGYADIARLLLDADRRRQGQLSTPTSPRIVDARLPDGSTALYWACRSGHLETIKLLIAAGADINQTKNNGGDALWVACLYSQIEVVNLLIAEGADVDSDSGFNSLLLAADDGYPDIVQVLLDAGAGARGRIDTRGSTGWAALHCASYEGHAEIVRLLLGAGADVNSLTEMGSTALHLAADAGHADIVRILLAEGNADVRAGMDAGEITALHKASLEGHAVIVRILLDAAADKNAAAGASASSSNSNSSNRSVAFVNAQRVPEQTTALMDACKGGHAEVVRILLAAGADAGIRDTTGWTPLMEAVHGTHLEVVRALLLADPAGENVDTQGPDGYAALHLAVCVAGRDGLSVLQLLLAHGAHVHARIEDGCTPLHLVCESGAAGMIGTLLRAGADVTLTDSSGRTPLVLAAENGWPSVVRVLLRCGAVTDEDKAAAVKIAEERGCKKIVKLLSRSRSAGKQSVVRGEYNADIVDRGFTSASLPKSKEDHEKSLELGVDVDANLAPSEDGEDDEWVDVALFLLEE